jgi:hypothetical protein
MQKMNTSDKRRYLEQLRTQLRFLETSSKLYDEGIEEEAIRIATTLRVLFHDTKSSTSLITHLGIDKSNLMVFTNSSYLDDNSNTKFFMPFLLDTQGGGYQPLLNNGPPTGRLMPLDQWWEANVLFANQTPIKRKQVALWAANKDGGAHVDESLPENYVAAFSTFEVVSVCKNTRAEIGRRPSNEPYVALRQAAFEILESTSITGIAN